MLKVMSLGIAAITRVRSQFHTRRRIRGYCCSVSTDTREMPACSMAAITLATGP